MVLADSTEECHSLVFHVDSDSDAVVDEISYLLFPFVCCDHSPGRLGSHLNAYLCNFFFPQDQLWLPFNP